MEQKNIDISHGVKNILQAMKGARDIVDNGLHECDIDRSRRGWQMLTSNLDRIEKLVMDVLKLSKDENARFKPCDFNNIIQEAVKNLQILAKNDKKHITFVIDESIGMVDCDEDMVYDIVLNLLINALYEIEPETGSVSISSSLDTNKSKAILTVCDNGPGIEDFDALFEPFKTSKPNLGSGLGLSIVRKNVELHGGSITVHNSPDSGAVFTVEIPIKRQ